MSDAPFSHSPRYGVHLTPGLTPLSQPQLERLLPVARQLDLGWVVLAAPTTRAVPESHIRPWLEQGAQVVLHLHAPPYDPPAASEVAPLLHAYARWGVRYVIWLNRPNQRAAWGDTWAQGDPAVRTADALLPLLQAAQEAGLTSLLPPLVQGGDYWDTAFLRRLLEELHRRAPDLLSRVALAVEARSFGHPLTWGQGGPEAWPETQPYATPPHSQDQRGFCVFDWYATIARAVLGQPLPMFLLRMGRAYGEGDPQEITAELEAIAALFGHRAAPPPAGVRLHPQVFGGAFWALAAPPGSPAVEQVWLPTEPPPRPIVERLTRAAPEQEPKGVPPPPGNGSTLYVLLPPEPEKIPWALKLVRPLVLHLRATVGFSLDEAARAKRVILAGDKADFPAEASRRLRQAGVTVHQAQHGTDIASLLSTLRATE